MFKIYFISYLFLIISQPLNKMPQTEHKNITTYLLFVISCYAGDIQNYILS